MLEKIDVRKTSVIQSFFCYSDRFALKAFIKVGTRSIGNLLEKSVIKE